MRRRSLARGDVANRFASILSGAAKAPARGERPGPVAARAFQGGRLRVLLNSQTQLRQQSPLSLREPQLRRRPASEDPDEPRRVFSERVHVSQLSARHRDTTREKNRPPEARQTRRAARRRPADVEDAAPRLRASKEEGDADEGKGPVWKSSVNAPRHRRFLHRSTGLFRRKPSLASNERSTSYRLTPASGVHLVSKYVYEINAHSATDGSLSSAMPELLDGPREPLGVAARHADDALRTRIDLVRRQDLRLAPVEQADAAIAQEHDVARVRVRVELALAKDLGAPARM